jgi:hypothetical protein
MEPGAHLDALLDALRVEGQAQRALLDGDEAAAREGFARASALYRTSWETAPPHSYGRLVGMLKAALIAGGGVTEAAYAREALRGAPEASPTAAYALAIAALVEGDDRAAAGAAARMRAGDAAFGRAADALEALALRRREAYEAAVRAVLADFEGRDDHLTGVPIADTALMLELLAAPRGMACHPPSALLPAA